MSVKARIREIKNAALFGALAKNGMKAIEVEGQLFPNDIKGSAMIYLVTDSVEDCHLKNLETDDGRISSFNSIQQLIEMLVHGEKGNGSAVRGKTEEEILSILQNTRRLFFLDDTSEGNIRIVKSWPFNKSIAEIMIDLDLYGSSRCNAS